MRDALKNLARCNFKRIKKYIGQFIINMVTTKTIQYNIKVICLYVIFVKSFNGNEFYFAFDGVDVLGEDNATMQNTESVLIAGKGVRWQQL